MLATLLIPLVLMPQNPPPPGSLDIDLPLLQNPAFASVAGVTGAHWCGAEGKVTQGAPTYVTLQPGERVFQAAAKIQHAATPAAISVQVRPNLATNVGLVTIGEGSQTGAAMIWQLIKGGYPASPWTAYEELPDGSWVPMNFRESAVHWVFQSLNNTPNHVNVVKTTIDTAVELWFDCGDVEGNADGVVCMVRPVLNDGGEVTVDVYQDSDGFGGNASVLLGSYTVDSQAPEGRDLLLRTEVLATDHLVFRATNNNPGTPVVLTWRPMIRHENERITYSFTRTGTPPTADAKEGVVPIQVTASAWSTRTLPFEADFQTRFGRPPVSPYIIELKGHVGGVDFTNVQCLQNRTTDGYAGFRATILTESDRLLDLYQSTHDNLPLSVPPVVNAWKLYVMDPQDGPELIVTQQGPVYTGSMPSNVRRLLDVGFWEREYDDYMEIVDTKFDPTNKHPVTRLYWPRYDCLADSFDTVTADQTTGLGDGGLALEAYRRTRDASYLEIARDYALVAAEHGVIDAPGVDILDGFILEGGYRLDDELNPAATDPGDEIVAWGVMGPASYLVQVAAELRAYHAAHPSQTELVPLPQLEDVALVAAQKALALKIFSTDGFYWGTWQGWWYALAYQFSDVYAYNANAAMEAADAIAPFAQSGVPQQLHATMQAYVLEGGLAYLETWKQNAARTAINAADQARTWPPYAWLIEKGGLLNAAQTADVREQLLRVARRLMAYQLPDGVWVNANQEEFYMQDFGGGGGTVALSAPTIGAALSQVIRADATNVALRDELYTRATDMFEAAMAFFAQDPLFPFGYVPDYFCAGMPDCTNPAKQTETRMLDNYLDCVAALDRLYQMGQSGPAPVLAISPQDYAPAPPVGSPTYFTMTVTAPAGEDVTDMLLNRTRIRLHQRNGSGPFVATDIWPGPPGSWALNINGQTANLMYLQPKEAGSEFKFELLAWTDADCWRRTTSLQRW